MAEYAARRATQRARQEAWDAAVAAGKRRGGRRPGGEPRKNRADTEPRANTTDPDVRVMRNQKGPVAGYNGQLVVTADQVIVGAMLSQHPVDRTQLHPPGHLPRATGRGRHPPEASYRARRLWLRQREELLLHRAAETAAARPARQGSEQAPHQQPSQKTRPGQTAGHRAGDPADAPPPWSGRLQTPGTDRRTGIRPDQDMPEAAHDVTPRGLDASRSEWLLMATAHNLRKLHIRRLSA